MKTLSEEISEIKNAKISKRAKKAALAKLGLIPYEVQTILESLRGESTIVRGRFTFGVEIECFVGRGEIRNAAAETGMAYEYQGYNHTDGHSYFKFVTDASVRGQANPIECVSPVLTGVNGKSTLEGACKTLNAAGATVNRTCGLHVHIGASKLTQAQYSNVFINYAYLEAVIDSFMAISRRGDNNEYAASIQRQIFELEGATTIAGVQRALCSRYHKINAQSYNRHRTIEFRQHAGTTNFEKIINWVNFCGKLVLWSKTHRLTAPVESIDDIPFLTEKEKSYFKTRANALG